MGAEFAGKVSDYDNVFIVLWESAHEICVFVEADLEECIRI